MLEDSRPFPLLTALDIENMAESINVHQFNDKAIRHTKSLGDELGLSTLGFHLVRLQSGDESTEFHRHHMDEEFVYILSGSGIAEIGDERCEISEGDFMGFSQGALPHSMSNPHEEDLVYLMGGTRSDIDICDYPKLNRRMYRVDGVKKYLDMDDLHDVHQTKP